MADHHSNRSPVGYSFLTENNLIREDLKPGTWKYVIYYAYTELLEKSKNFIGEKGPIDATLDSVTYIWMDPVNPKGREKVQIYNFKMGNTPILVLNPLWKEGMLWYVTNNSIFNEKPVGQNVSFFNKIRSYVIPHFESINKSSKAEQEKYESEIATMGKGPMGKKPGAMEGGRRTRHRTCSKRTRRHRK